MRMWMVPTRMLCRKHLTGEHLEVHMYIGALRKGKNLDGYFYGNLLEPLSLRTRHNVLASEMLQRGYDHKSPISDVVLMEALRQLPSKLRHVRINKEKSLQALLNRCPECRVNFERLYGELHVRGKGDLSDKDVANE